MLMAVSCWFSFLKTGTNPTSTTFQLKAFVAPEDTRGDLLHPWCSLFYRQAVSPTHSLVSQQSRQEGPVSDTMRSSVSLQGQASGDNQFFTKIFYCVTLVVYIASRPVNNTSTFLLWPPNPGTDKFSIHCMACCSLPGGHKTCWDNRWCEHLSVAVGEDMQPDMWTLAGSRECVRVCGRVTNPIIPVFSHDSMRAHPPGCQSPTQQLYSLSWFGLGFFSFFFFFSIHQEHKYFETLGLGGNSPGGKALCWVNTCILPPSPPFSRRAAGGFPPFQSHINIQRFCSLKHIFGKLV